VIIIGWSITQPNIQLMGMLTAEDCRHFLSLYTSALVSRTDDHRAKDKSKDLPGLDSWRLKELAKAVRERSPSYMRKDELEKLMDCKLYVMNIPLLIEDPEESLDRD
jgi:hypothetical protein